MAGVNHAIGYSLNGANAKTVNAPAHKTSK